MASKFCENCGASLVEAAKFCESCGTQVPGLTVQSQKLNQPRHELSPMPIASTSPSASKKPFYKNWWLWLVAVLVMGLVISVASSGSSSPKKLIVGTWVCLDDGDTFYFNKDGTYLNTYGAYRGSGTYKIDSKKALIVFDDNGDRYTYLWDLTKAINDDVYWYVSKDQLIFEEDVFVRRK